MSIKEEIEKRRTFGIISHPDAGKTTLTEKLLHKLQKYTNPHQKLKQK